MNFFKSYFSYTRFHIHSFVCICILSLVASYSYANVDSLVAELKKIKNSKSALQQNLVDLDRRITSEKAKIIKEQSEARERERALARDEKRLTKSIETLAVKQNRAKDKLGFANSNLRDLENWYQGLGVLEKGLNSGTYDEKKTIYLQDKKLAQTELEKHSASMVSLKKDLLELSTQREALKPAPGELQVENNPRIRSILGERDRKSSELAKVKGRLLSVEREINRLVRERRNKGSAKKAAIKPKQAEPQFNAYVFAISGRQPGSVEKALRLKNWVESYNSKYIEGNWNDLNAKVSAEPGDDLTRFIKQFEKQLAQIPKSAHIVLIGHGLGGGSAVIAATQIAEKMNRTIDYLVTLDPIGSGDLRMNIVYQTPDYCSFQSEDVEPASYFRCMDGAKRRKITSNVSNFYNRWQKESTIPLDALDASELLLGQNGRYSSTGKFSIESTQTRDNQRRLFFSSPRQAHQLVLTQAAAELPRLLVPFIREPKNANK